MRLPLDQTMHIDRFDDTGLDAAIEDYDRRREVAQPYATRRAPDRFGAVERYGWSEDKARQYALPERTGFGAFLARKGFRLE